MIIVADAREGFGSCRTHFLMHAIPSERHGLQAVDDLVCLSPTARVAGHLRGFCTAASLLRSICWQLSYHNVMGHLQHGKVERHCRVAIDQTGDRRVVHLPRSMLLHEPACETSCFVRMLVGTLLQRSIYCTTTIPRSLPLLPKVPLYLAHDVLAGFQAQVTLLFNDLAHFQAVLVVDIPQTILHSHRNVDWLLCCCIPPRRRLSARFLQPHKGENLGTTTMMPSMPPSVIQILIVGIITLVLALQMKTFWGVHPVVRHSEHAKSVHGVATFLLCFPCKLDVIHDHFNGGGVACCQRGSLHGTGSR